MKISWAQFRAAVACVLAGALLAPPAQALVTLNDSHDHLFVSAGAGMTYDSNVFAQSGGRGDVLYTTTFSAEYQRRAGWIGVNANASISGARFGKFEDQDFTDPTLSLEFTKQTGRTTGSVTLNAQRESRADAAVNTRTTSWNFTYGTNFRYRISGQWDLAGSFGYFQRKYTDSTTYANLNTFSSSLDVFHIMTSERDLILGYRYRYNDQAADAWSVDHNLSAGLHGKLIRGIYGTVRVGYQVRQPHEAPGTPGAGSNKQFHSWTASGSTSYAINKKANLGFTISKDFSITATDSSIDTLMTSADFQYAYSSHWALSSSVGLGTTKFLVDNPTPSSGPSRKDTNMNWNAALSYSLNEHLKLAFTYVWFKNWSTVDFADFVRSTWSLTASSRW